MSDTIENVFMEKSMLSDPSIREIIIRNGAAPEIKDPVPIRFSGKIDAPADFLEYRGGWGSGYFDPFSTMVIARVSERTITLYRDQRSSFRDSISGALPQTAWLNALRINHDTGWAPLDLAKFIRRAGIMSPDETARFVSVLQAVTMKAKVDAEFKNDSRGNTTNKIAKELETNLPRFVEFNFPLFEGDTRMPIVCDLFIEDKNGPVVFLEIPGLDAMIEERAIDRIEKEIARIKEIAPGITLLYE